MTKRPSNFELYTCCILIWAALVTQAFLLIVQIAGGPPAPASGLVVVFATLAWRKDIELRRLRWATEHALLLMSEDKR
jgi:hypothetical protein